MGGISGGGIGIGGGSGGGFSGWRLMRAVVTTDAYLHLLPIKDGYASTTPTLSYQLSMCEALDGGPF